MNLKKLGVAAAVSLAVGVSVVDEAHADAYAIGLIDITNFMFVDANQQAISLTAFSSLSFVDTLTNTALLNGALTATGAQNPPGVFQNLDPLAACLGACPGQNLFTQVDAPPPNTTFARADSILTGAPFANAPLPVGVHAGTVAETTLNTSPSVGGSTSDMNLTSSFTFVLAQPVGSLGISFDALAFLQAWTIAGSTPPTAASSEIGWTFTLSQGNTELIEWTPGDTSTGLNVVSEPCTLNEQADAGPNEPNAPTNLIQAGGVAGPIPGSCSGHFLAFTGIPLLAGVQYSVTITQHTQSQATQVALPEPSSLLLLGLGILGLGFVRRFA